MSMSGGPSTAAVKADNLKKLGILVAESRPWYEALGMTAERASSILGEDMNDYVSEQGSGLGRKSAELLFSAADVDALKPVCVVFKALFDAVKGAATNRNDLINLIDYGVLIVKSIPETGPTNGLSPAVKHALRAFGEEVESLMQLAGSFGITQQPTFRRGFRRVLRVPRSWRRRAQEVGNYAEINKVIQGHVTQFDRIVRVIGAGAAVQSAEEAKAVLAIGKAASRTQLSIAAMFGAALIIFAGVIIHMIIDLRPTPLPDMTVVPAGALAMFGAVLLVFAAVMCHTVSRLRPPSLSEMAAVPRGAIALTVAHISRASLLGSAVSYLTNTVVGDAPCVLAGMAGGGKSFLASAVVRDEKVREHFRAGMFWWRVGHDAKDQLLEWLEGLVLRVASTSGVTPPRLDSLEDVTRYLKAECANAQRLVVLDDVWEREIVDALKLTGLQLLVTTRDRSVVTMPGKCVEVGDMEEDEALEVLRVGCGAPKSLELPRFEVLQVVHDCRKLPLSLGLAAPLLKGPPQDPKSWRVLHEALHTVMTTRLGNDRIMTVPERVDAVLEVSLGAMADDPAKRKRCLFLAVLAPGTLAPFDMLEDLWDEAPGATKKIAAQLVDQSMLQPAGDAFRVHDLVLRFLKLKLKADPSRSTATCRIAEYLGQLRVLQGYVGAGETRDGVYSLIALWRSVENLAEEIHVATAYSKNLDGISDSPPWQQAGRLLELMGKYDEADSLYQRALAIDEKLLRTQGKYAEAEPLYERCQAIKEKVLGPEHPSLATTLNNRAVSLYDQENYREAILLLQRALAIRTNKLGKTHPDTVGTRNNLEAVRQKV
eukprot:g6863.t1